MGSVLPILFNSDMVRAILDGRKTATRRVVKYEYSNTEMKMRTDKYGTRLIEIQKNIEGETYGKRPDGGTWHKLLAFTEKKPPCRKGDILYVRETYCPDYFDFITQYGNRHAYKAEYNKDILSSDITEPKWIPSIHMPKEAARIWIKVIDVRVERLQDISLDDCLREGIDADRTGIYIRFSMLWDSTIKKADISRYGWDANPWVWVIGFEQCGKPESEG